MVPSTFRVQRLLARQVASRVVVCAAVIVTMLLGNSAAHAQVVHLKGDRKNGSGAVIGIDKPREGVPKTYIVLTAYHVMKDNTPTIEGQPVMLIAKDETTDLALVTVAGIDSAGYFVATSRIPSTGKAVLYGYPGNEYSTQDCTVDEKGDLSCKVRAGGSGGPLIKGNYFVIGVLTRYHGVATRSQIESFLTTAGYDWLLQITKDYEHLYAAEKAPAALDDFDKHLEELRTIVRDLARQQREHEEEMRRLWEEYDRRMR